MALDDTQRAICRLIARHRLSSGESYVAGAAALNEVLAAARLSRDIDLFHDTDAAVAATWDADRALLEANGYRVSPLRSMPSFVEAHVEAPDGASVRIEWARDSAFRFFPLVEHPIFGLVLHPVDLATNKVLAMVGRVEVRDWVDVIHSAERLQPLGYLAWAASGKDPGFSPAAILEHAARTGRYSAEEVASLAFEGPAPDAAALARRWHELLQAARETVAALPAEQAGTCVLEARGELFRGSAAEAITAHTGGRLLFHAGSIRGAYPRIVG